MAQYEEQFCDAVEILIKQALADAKFDRTYQVVIKDDSQADKGIYQVQYQDAIVSASTIGNTLFHKDEIVYILVPEDDWSKEKKILGYSSDNTFNGNLNDYWISRVERVNDELYLIEVTDGTNYYESRWTVTTDELGDSVWTCDSGQVIDMIGFRSSDTISDQSPYVLPKASTTVLGGVKLDGVTITINDEGVISSTGGSVKVEIATYDKPGIVKPDGKTIFIDEEGMISTQKPNIRIHDHVFDQLQYSYDEASTTLKLLMMPIRLEHEIDSDDYENYEIKKF